MEARSYLYRIDRYTGYPTIFVKSTDEFINSFDLIEEKIDENKEKQ